jgi:hypothetical protein
MTVHKPIQTTLRCAPHRLPCRASPAWWEARYRRSAKDRRHRRCGIQRHGSSAWCCPFVPLRPACT